MFDVVFSFYNIMLFLGLILNVFVSIYLARKYSYRKAHMFYLLIFETIGIILGSKLYIYITQYNVYKNNFNIFEMGMASLGGLIGAIVMIIIFSIIFKKSLSIISCILLPSIPLMYSIVKIGCHIAGCCRGIIYNGFGAVTYEYGYERDNISYFPIQLVESAVFIIIFIYLFYLHKKNKFDIKTIGLSFILLGIAKFSLDFLRLSHANIVLSTNQIISLLFIVLGIIIYKKNKKLN